MALIDDYQKPQQEPTQETRVGIIHHTRIHTVMISGTMYMRMSPSSWYKMRSVDDCWHGLSNPAVIEQAYQEALRSDVKPTF